MKRGRARDFGFPRWGGYGRDSEAVHVRLCDRVGCDEPGDYPAPKSPGGQERWYFCQTHAAEYNRSWNFFEGMNAQEAHAYAQSEQEFAKGFRQSDAFSWGGSEDADGLTRNERQAFETLELDTTASGEEIKAQFRSLAKRFHPDRNPGDRRAAQRFHEIRNAYEVLRART